MLTPRGGITEAMQVLSDVTTDDVSITKHGYAPKAPNDAAKYLDGTGGYTVPAGSGGSDATLSVSDITTNNVTSTKHGFAPKSAADATKFLNSAATPAYAQVKDSDLSLSDITTNNVTSTMHGLAPKAPADATKFLNGAATPAYALVKDSDLSTSDITTNDVVSTKHGFAPKSPADATKFLNGAATPAYALVKDSDLSTSDITTNDVSTSKHGFAPKAPNDATKYLDGTGAYSVPAGSSTTPNNLVNGRLTLTTGLPFTTADVTAATSIYFTPHNGNRVSLWNGSAWIIDTFTEITLALGTLVAFQAYDVFAYDSSGTVTLETLEWKNATVTMTIATPGVVTWTAHAMSTGNSITFTNSGGALPTGVTANTQYYITVVDANTFKLSTSLANVAAGTFIATSGSQSGTHTGHQPQARGTAVTLQDGVYAKSGDKTRRYLGTFFTTATTTTEDSAAKRFLWNCFNRARRPLRRVESTFTWAVNLNGVWRQANAAVANKVEGIIGLAESTLDLSVIIGAAGSAGVGFGGAIGEDSTTTADAANVGLIGVIPTGGQVTYSQTRCVKVPAAAYHAWNWLEQTDNSSVTFYAHRAQSAGNSQIENGLSGSLEG